MLKSIIFLLLWPIVIIISYQFIKLMLKKFEKNLKKNGEETETVNEA